MRSDLDKQLVQAFPNLYRDRYLPPTKTCMCWGFECGSGWFGLIWTLSEKLEEMISEIPEADRDRYAAAQTKSKFGRLCFYMTSSTPEMNILIQEAESKSFDVCEGCGKDNCCVPCDGEKHA